MKLWPFFCYYGGKWRSTPHYPTPKFDVIIEPFAGAAGYATRYHTKKIYLVDADPVICGVWEYLIRVSETEFMRLPNEVSHVDDIVGPQEARWFVGFWLNKATTAPCKTPSAWMRSGIRPNSQWGTAIKNRVASQLACIRHWKIKHGSYDVLPNGEATWFIDPPYNNSAGKLYRFRKVDYTALAAWCKNRVGQTIVCENSGADWLPFSDLGVFKSTEGKHGKSRSKEAIFVQEVA